MSGKMTKQFKTAIINKLKNIDIPNWEKYKYIATDKNGEVWGYKMKPEIDSEKGHWNVVESYVPSDMVYLFDTDFDSTNWKKTLIALETIKIDVTVKLEPEPEVRNIEAQCIASPSQPKSVLRFKLWQPADTFLVYQILEAENIPNDTKYKYTSNIEYGLLHPEMVVKNHEGIEIFSSKEDRHAFINKMIKNLKELFSKDEKVKATEKDIGKNVETECGVAKLEALTTDGKYVVTFDGVTFDGVPRLFVRDNAWVNIKSDCDFNKILTPGSSVEYYFAR